MTPMISVVVPCYNAERYIAATLESVLAQIAVRWEAIVIDDGSTDNSLEIVKAIALRFDGRLRVVSGPNLGVSAARNAGTEMALGQFIQYLDADDLLRPGTLARRLECLSENSGCEVAYCDWQRLAEQPDGSFQAGKVESRSMEDVHPRADIALFTRFWCPPAALLYRSTVVDRIGGWRTNLPVIQDARFALDAALQGARFVQVPGVGADYRDHLRSSLSKRDPVAFVRDVLQNACEIEQIWRANGELGADQISALTGAYDYAARSLLAADPTMFKVCIAHLQALRTLQPFSYPSLAKLLLPLLGARLTSLTLESAIALRRRIK